MRVLRASELGSYLYCARAWWYQRQGVPSEIRRNLRPEQTFISSTLAACCCHFSYGRRRCSC